MASCFVCSGTSGGLPGFRRDIIECEIVANGQRNTHHLCKGCLRSLQVLGVSVRRADRGTQATK